MNCFPCFTVCYSAWGIYVAAIPDEASASAISLCEWIVAKINEIKEVFPVPPGVTKNQIPSVPY